MLFGPFTTDDCYGSATYYHMHIGDFSVDMNPIFCISILRDAKATNGSVNEALVNSYNYMT